MSKQAGIKAAAFGVSTFLALALLAKVVLPEGTFTGTFWLFLLLAALLLAGGSQLFFASGGSVTDQDMLDAVLKDVADGDFAAAGESRARRVLESFPGFQRVLRSFQNLIGYMQDTADSVSRASHDLSAKARSLFREAEEEVRSVKEVRGSLAHLEGDIEKVVASADTLSGFTEKTSSAVLEMRSSIEEVLSATHNLSGFVDEISASIEEMARSVDEVAKHGESLSSFAVQNASAMVEMDATIGQIEENIQETDGLSGQVLVAVQSGQSVVRETVSALDAIHTAMARNLEVMGSLSERSRDVGKILKVIREIADQTNLLALNAAIIAAQAGEHGRSFGVVAEEIRDLSERTTISTAEVATILGAVQKDSEDALNAARHGMERVEEGLRLGKESQTNLARIKESMDLAGTSISHIVRAASEQAKGSRQVTSAIEEMTKRIERISLATREQARTARHVSEKSLVMKDLTRSVDRAMQEESQGSNTIAEGMELVSSSVDEIQKALIRMSQTGQKILGAVDTIGGATQQTFHQARDLSGTSASLRQEALLLVQELETFKLPKPEQGGELRVGGVHYDFNLDPAYANNIRDHELAFNYAEGLLRLGYGTQVVPALADSWQVSADGKVYTFHVRNGAMFHHGRKVEAADVLYSWHRAASPRLHTDGKAFLSWVEGFEAFREGKAQTIQGLKAPDDQTVEVRLTEPLAFFLYLLTTPEAYVIPREAIDEASLRLVRPVGAGPFRVTDTSPDRLVLERFTGYYDPSRPHLDRLIYDYHFRAEPEVLAALVRGDVHYVTTLSNEGLAGLTADPHWQNLTEVTVQLATMFISIRNDLPPYDSKEVRQAMNYAVDRDFLVSQFGQGRATVSRGLLPPGILGYRSDVKGFTYDPDKARWLLSKAGFGSGLDLKVAVDSSRVRQAKEFSLVVEMLRRVGIRIEVEPVSHETYETRRRAAGRPGLYATGWYADYPDPDSFLYFLFYSKGGDVLEIRYRNAEMDDLVEKGRRSLDVEERAILYQRAEDIIIEDAPCIFLYHSRGMVPHGPDVMGMKLSMTTPTVRPENIWLSSQRRS